jgi:hypothetical protein
MTISKAVQIQRATKTSTRTTHKPTTAKRLPQLIRAVAARKKEVIKAENSLLKVTERLLVKGKMSAKSLDKILTTGIDPTDLSQSALTTNNPSLIFSLIRARFWNCIDSYDEQTKWNDLAYFAADIFCDQACQPEVAEALIERISDDWNCESLRNFMEGLTGAIPSYKHQLLKSIESVIEEDTRW